MLGWLTWRCSGSNACKNADKECNLLQPFQASSTICNYRICLRVANVAAKRALAVEANTSKWSRAARRNTREDGSEEYGGEYYPGCAWEQDPDSTCSACRHCPPANLSIDATHGSVRNEPWFQGSLLPTCNAGLLVFAILTREDLVNSLAQSW
jgi:hypothetical protein